MIPGRIEGATRTLAAPPNWDKEKAGPCRGLAIRDAQLDGVPVMTSAWFPTPTELAALQAGAPLILWVVGIQHPPVTLTTGNVPEDQS